MTGKEQTNRRIVLASRPSGSPVPANFRLESTPIPKPGPSQILLHTLWLSLDPYMRGLMSDGPSYAPRVGIGEVMVGGTVSRVVASNHDDFASGDLVLGSSGWQDYALFDGSDLTKLPADMAFPSWMLGVLGMPGFAAWHGTEKIGEPKAGETVVVAAASGPVGATVGQIAKIRGALSIGVAGGAKKCRHVVEALGFDACIDHRAPDFAAQLRAACPKGIDVYFENVGGAVFDAVLPLLNAHARIPLCGLIAHYNDENASQPSPDRLPSFMSQILSKRFRVQGFIISDHYAEEHACFAQKMGEWVRNERIRYFEDIVDGLEKAPEAFIGLLEGRNNGKLVVRMSGN